MNLLEPERKTLEELFFDIKNGHYGIPSFQRDFDWKRSDINDLFESIIRGFYIGSILLWNSPKPEELSPTPLFGMIKPINFLPKYLVLDGQQRLSSIFYAITGINEKLGSEKYPVKFFVRIDKVLRLFFTESQNIECEEEAYEEKDKIIYAISLPEYKKKSLDFHDRQFKEKLFPLYELNNYDEWIDEYVNSLVGDSDENKKIIKRNLRVFFKKFWTKYQIPIIKLPREMNLLNIGKIFEKLNTKGKNLTVFDLLNARFTQYKIFLRQKLLPLVEENSFTKEYSDHFIKFPILLLQTMCIKRGKLIKTPSILKLEPYQFEENWNEMLKDMAHVIEKIENLRGEYGIYHPKWHPYPSMMPGLSELMSIAKEQENMSSYLKKISCWFWAICYSGDYDSASDSKTTRDIKAIKNWFDDESMTPSFIKNRNDVRLEETDIVTSSTNAMFKSIVCLIALNKARDFLTDEVIEDNPDLDIHHIFPRSLKIDLKNKNHINSILNKTLISAKTNRKYIGAKKPSEYIQLILKETGITEEKLISRFETHLISREAFVCLKNNDFYGFIEERKITIKKEFKKRIEAFN